MPMVMFKKKFHLNNRITGAMEPCHPEEIAFKDFLEFLETCRNRTRPAYDGVVLFCQEEETLPLLLRFVRRMNLEAWFWRLVVALGALYPYIEAVHCQDPRVLRWKLALGGPNTCALDLLYQFYFGNKVNTKGSFSDLKANYNYQILLKLVQNTPNYLNFFRVGRQ